MKRQRFVAAHIKHCTNPGTQARAELGTQYNTSCGRINFWLHELIGKSCSVYLFIASYNLMRDVHIDTCLKLYTFDYERTWVIVFNEVLWFGTIMDHSLVNPNQI